MITVRGEDPETVQLADLNDFIYYKQVKTFSEEEYKKSNSLQRAISKGSVIVLKRVDEKFSGYETPQNLGVSLSNKDNTDINPLIELLKSIESKIGSTSSQTNSVSLDVLIQKIEALENRLQTPVSADNSTLLDTIHKLEEKVNQTTNNPAFQRLEDLLAKISGSVYKGTSEKESEPVVPDEVYVPNIKVEDGNSHINLKVRTVESSNDVNSASEALKRLKKQNT